MRTALLGLLLTVSPSAAAGHSEVVAQRVVTLGGGAHHWLVTPIAVDAEQASVPTAHPSFLVALSGVVTLGDGAGSPQFELEAGEAAVVLAGDGFTHRSADDGPAELLDIAMADGVPGGATGEVGEAFELAGGEYDFELIRDVLAPAEVLTLAAGAAPTLVAADGDVLVTGDAATMATELAAGTAATFPGSLTVVNLGEQPASVLATSVTPAGTGGPTESSAPAESSEPAASTGSEPAPSSPTTPTTSAPAPSSTAAGGATTSIPATSSTTVAPGPADTLDPGAINTNPSSFRDSDNDGLTDAEEAAFGSDPNHFDTDLDALNDDREAYLGTDPRNPDTDGDGMEDGFEDLFFDNPLDPTDYPGAGEVDTDGDRYSDNLETLIGYDPNDPSSHP
jgi:hypothetical protein